MDFSLFLENISKIEDAKLGGLDAQFKLAPKMRSNYAIEKESANQVKKAAVLVLFYPNDKGETCFLLTLRASYKGTHSSQISFPGGKFDTVDNVLKNTALRETYEEVGIQRNNITIFKQMTNTFIPPSNFMVTPFLGYLKQVPAFKKNHEVAKLISISLDDLLNDSSISTTTLTTSYAKNITVPCFKLNSYVVWGATAMMLSEVRELIKRF